MASIIEVLKKDIAHKADYLVSPSGDLDSLTGLDNVKNALFHRLVTQPGSLVHRPTYGVGIKSFQNAPNTIETQRRIALRIKEQFEQDPRVEEVLGVRVESGDLTPENIKIIVRVKLSGYEEVTTTFIPFGEVTS